MVPKLCSIDNCFAAHHARGYCGAHYAAWRKSTPAEARTQPTREQRFSAKVDNSHGPEACWHWKATIGGEGYGQFHDGTRNVKAHRYAYELEHGPIAAGLVVDHTCHNDSGCTAVPCDHRKCCNPAHLEAVTQKINSIRGRSGEHQARKTHCPKGHEYTPENILSRRGYPTYRGCRECSRIANRKYQSKRKAA